MHTNEQTPHLRLRHPMLVGFAYWFSFLTALEPGLIQRAADAGVALGWTSEVARIFGASALGALATPVLLALLNRFPPGSRWTWSVVAVRAAGPVLIAFGLIVLSCLLAPLAQLGDTRPFWIALPDHLVSNLLLMSFVIGGLSALLHVLGPRPQETLPLPAGVAATPEWLTHVHIKARGQVTVVDLSAVDWIEAQGNYVALHNGQRTHLLRETLSSLEARLDPTHFVRIHRSRLVAKDRVTAVMPCTNGDATITLSNGTELRVSRSFRARLRERMDQMKPRYDTVSS